MVMDSNVYRYSKEEIEEYESYHDRNTQFESVDTIGDLISRPSAGINLRKSFIRRRPTEFTFVTEMSLFARNTIKNYENYQFELRQQLTDSDVVKIGFAYIPKYFVQNFFDTDLRAYGRAYYAKHSLETFWRHDFNQYLRFRFLYELANRKYATQFQERDSYENTFNFALIFPHIAVPWLRGKVFYEFSSLDARGSDDDPQVDVNISNLVNGVGGELEAVVFKKLHWTGFMDYHYRWFTTGHAVDVDPFHSGRHDDRWHVGVRGEYDITPYARLFAQWEYIQNDAHTKTDTSTQNTPGDILDFDSHLGTIGIRCDF